MSVSKGAFPWGGRGDRMIHEERQDPYRLREKPEEPCFCPQCGAVYHEGRWKWMNRPHEAATLTCPACRRIHDGVEAGIVTLKGDFLKTHGKELINIARNEEKKENSEHPLHRIINIKKTQDSITITTTDIHLPRGIGEAVRHACQGDLDLDYDEESYYIRVNWSR